MKRWRRRWLLSGSGEVKRLIVRREGSALPIGSGPRHFNGILNMNEPSVSIMKLLETDTTMEEIISKLKAQYPDSTDKEIRDAVIKLIMQLRMEGLLAE